jgi:CheY-like chemotaxis protein
MPSKTRRILLIDDDESATTAARSALAGYAVELDVVRDGAVAFDRARAGRPDAIVLAVELSPQKQGYNLCRRFKKSADLRPIPLLLLSQGDPYLEDHKKLSTRADAYLLKPFTAGDFLAALASLVGALPRAAGPIGEEIVELEDAQIDSEGSEATVIAEVVEDIGDADIVTEEPEAGAAPGGAPKPPSRPAPARAPFLAMEDDQSFDAMLDSLEFKDNRPPGSAKLASVDAEIAALRQGRTGPAPSPAAPPRPAAAPDQAAAAVPAWKAEEQDARERELLDYKERLASAEQQARDRGERLASLEREVAELRSQVEVLGRSSTSKEKELAEEIAFRERELFEQRAQLERLADEHTQWLERTHHEHAEALAQLRSELEVEKTRAVQNAQQERGALEGALQQRLRDIETLHERSLAEARAEAQRNREQAAKALRESEAARLRLAELERTRENMEIGIEERTAAAADLVRRPLEEELGRRAEEHAHEIQELKRRHMQELEAAEARAGATLAELERLSSEIRTHESALAQAYEQSSAREAELRKARADLAEAERLASEREAGIAAAARQASRRDEDLQRRNAELEEKVRALESRVAETQRLLSEREGELHRKGADFESKARELEEQLARALRALKQETARKDRLKQAADILGKLLEEEKDGT